MFIIRPAALNDLDALEKFAFSVSLGMISLPRDRNLLLKKIEHSIESFDQEITVPKNEAYWFVLENTKTGEVVGSTGIKAKSGVKEPLYFFRIEVQHPQSSAMPVPDEIRILHPISLSNGPSELCALYLAPEWRSKGIGELLSLSRFLFIAGHPHRFENIIMAVLRGFISKSRKTSPFWEGLGRHFLNLELHEIYSMLEQGRSFIPDFLPKYPIYVSLLTKQAQYVIGKPHISTRPALKMLKKQGFKATQDIDILEAGPVISAQKNEIRTIKGSVLATVEGRTQKAIHSKRYVISNNNIDFRACCDTLEISGEHKVLLTEEVMKALKVNTGDKIRYAKTY
ncbi:MAG: Arginine N-succinyltransferase [Chlamydiae bacterium]|nr:Arginine N-succinyltransferase [Chlamydiota bacterium]